MNNSADLTIDYSNAQALINQMKSIMKPKQFENAMYGVLRRTAAHVKTILSNDLPKEYVVERKDVKSATQSPQFLNSGAGLGCTIPVTGKRRTVGGNHIKAKGSLYGWDTVRNYAFLKRTCASFKERGIRTSIFIDPDPKMAEGAARCGADRVELYTAPYAAGYAEDREKAVAPFLETARAARDLGLGLNAGHDLSLENLAYLIRTIPWIDEVSIGHALICDALYMGLETTIRDYLSQIQNF